MNRNKLFIYSLTSLAVMTSSLAYAGQVVTVPTLEGGLTAEIGTFYVQPSAETFGYASVPTGSSGDGFENSLNTVQNLNPDYQFGIDAMLGYIFEETANGIELSYRNIGTSDTDAITYPSSSNLNQKVQPNEFIDTSFDAGFELNAFDLMISQYINIGNSMQMRFNGGLSYVELEEQGTLNSASMSDLGKATATDTVYAHAKSKFTGWGPRVGIDARYDFGQGIGIVGGGSLAYYLGTFKLNSTSIETEDPGTPDEFITTDQVVDNIDGQSITNLRANLGIDYVFFFEEAEGTTLGLELGYLVDYYADAVVAVGGKDSGNVNGGTLVPVIPYDVTFSGPYLSLKGVF